MIKTGQTIAVADYVIVTTAGEALSARDAVYIKTSDGKAYKCDADDLTTMDFAGFAQEAASLNAAVNVIPPGVMATGFSSLTIGARYFISGTAGAITATAPTNAKAVGYAVSATVIKMDLPPTKRVVTFSAGGTWTKRPGLKYIELELQGAGGGGGGGSATNIGGGGGSGAYSRTIIYPNALGSTETVSIGAAGSAGSASNNGGNGGDTSLGTLAVAGGGTGGLTGNPGSGSAAGAASGSITANFSYGNAGGNGLNDTGAVAPDFSNSGAGGNSMFGQGGQSRVSGTPAASGVMAGEAAHGYGAGGSGAIGNTSGGAGTIGYAIVNEFY